MKIGSTLIFNSLLKRYLMLATLVSIILVVVFTLMFQVPALGFFPILALVVGALMILITPLIKGLTLLPLQAASVETSSRAMNMARKDPLQIALTFVWISFALFSFISAAFGTEILFIIWMIWLGLSLDAIFFYTWRQTGFSDPLHLIVLLVRNGKRNFSANRQKELCSSIDALGEVSLKALFQKSLPLSEEVVSSMEGLAKDYLKSFGADPTEDAANRVNYTLGFLLHRMQMLFNHAAEDNLEPLANQIILSVSKLTINVAKFDTSLTSLPLHFLENFFKKAHEYELTEVAINSSIVLQEMAKSMIEDPSLRDRNLSRCSFFPY